MSTVRPRTVSGMRPTGPLHLGHYFGVLKNWVELQHTEEAYFFVADWHALTSDYADPSNIATNVEEMVKDWVAAGLDPEKCVIFRQSAVKEHAELSLLLSMITPVSWLERNPTYKEQQQQITNKDLGNAGFLCYPVLMAADILMYRPHGVPVGEDQLPHMELTREIARRFNYLYGGNFFPEPQAMLTPAAKCPGLDGRKMSKSYNNVIPLFEGGRKALDEAISRIVTDSRLPGEPKDPDSTSLTVIYDAFATEEESAAFRQELRDGLGWGEAKKRLADKIDAEIGPMRQRYEDLMAHPEQIEAILQQGAARARVYATDLIAKLRYAVGLRSFQKLETASATKAQKKKAPATLFKQYRESDGLFYFKLTHEGSELLVSDGLESGRDAGQWVGRLKKDPASLAEAPVHFAEGVAADNVVALLKSLAED